MALISVTVKDLTKTHFIFEKRVLIFIIFLINAKLKNRLNRGGTRTSMEKIKGTSQITVNKDAKPSRQTSPSGREPINSTGKGENWEGDWLTLTVCRVHTSHSRTNWWKLV